MIKLSMPEKPYAKTQNDVVYRIANLVTYVSYIMWREDQYKYRIRNIVAVFKNIGEEQKGFEKAQIFLKPDLCSKPI